MLVTFIIPHYNTNPSYLHRLINSIPDRKDLEILIIDDNSSSDIIDKQQLKSLEKVDSRIRVLLQTEGCGPGYVRNYGLNVATGDWVIFADSDDFFIKDNLASLLTKIEGTSYDVVWYGFGTELYGFFQKDDLQSVDENEKWRFVKVMAPWNKIIRREFLIDNSILFGSEMYCEDQIFSVRLVGESVKTGIYTDQIYSYEVNEGSLSKTIDLSRLKKGIEIEFKCNNLIKKYGHLCVECRNILIGGLLFRIFQQSKVLYWFYVVKELLIFGYKITKADFEITSGLRFVRPSILSQILDPIRVKMGSLLN